MDNNRLFKLLEERDILIYDEIMTKMEVYCMLLPMDMDDVPIHVGDELECDANGYKGTFTVLAVGYEIVIGNHEIEWIKDNPGKWFHIASYCRHVKPRITDDKESEYGKENLK